METPHWPTPDNWLLHPLAWQLTFVLGFVLASPKGIGGWARANIGVLRIAAIPMLVLGYLVARQGWLNGLINENPDWPLLLGLSKHYDAPLRVLHLLSLLAVGSLLYPWIARFAPLVVRYFNMLGRHSLNVFAANLLLSIAASRAARSTTCVGCHAFGQLAFSLLVSGLVAALVCEEAAARRTLRRPRRAEGEQAPIVAATIGIGHRRLLAWR
ncbi:MAG: OpgC domain-containing protein [Hyphomicrobiales bacterium]